MTLDPAVLTALRGGLALLLLHAAGHKLSAPARFVAALEQYRIVGGRVVPAAAALLVAAELATGVALLVPGAGPAPALAAALLLSTYAAAIALNLMRGRRDIECGCAGPAGRRPLSAALVARNGLLVLIAGLAALPSSGRALSWLDGFTVAACLAAAALLYASADLALANQPRLAALRGPR